MWLHKSTNRIRLAIATDYSNPTVEATVYDRQTMETLSGTVTWPVTLAEDSPGEFSTLIDCDEVETRKGQRLRVEVDFDAGADNCRLFVLDTEVGYG